MRSVELIKRPPNQLLPTTASRHVALRRTILLLISALCVSACSSEPERADARIELAILTLNLHTYQELHTEGTPEAELSERQALQRIEAYGPIFDRIAAGIVELDPDIVCLQEVGEWPGDMPNDPESVQFGSSDTNMVHQILSRLGDRHYYYTMDWSHYGWDVWLEGSAILSKYSLSFTESRFVSNPDNGRRESWKSRNVPMAKLDVPRMGAVTVFSVHTGWWDDPDEPLQDHYRRLLNWAAEVSEPASTTVLCGDFNIAAGSPMYPFLTRGTGFSDQYALANPDGMFDATIGGGADGWEDNSSGQRIDYILINDDSSLEVKRARRVFTEQDLGRVSDHVGIFAEFEIARVR